MKNNRLFLFFDKKTFQKLLNTKKIKVSFEYKDKEIYSIVDDEYNICKLVLFSSKKIKSNGIKLLSNSKINLYNSKYEFIKYNTAHKLSITDKLSFNDNENGIFDKKMYYHELDSKYLTPSFILSLINKLNTTKITTKDICCVEISIPNIKIKDIIIKNKILIDTLELLSNDDKFINNVCLSYRHDFGLLSEKEQNHIKFELKEWFRAINNNLPYTNETYL